MRMVVLAAILASSYACTTTDENTEEAALASIPAPVDTNYLVEMHDASAQAMFAAFNVNAGKESAGAKKTHTGLVDIHCSHTATYTCAVYSGRTPAPSDPAMIKLTGDPARDFYFSFDVDEKAGGIKDFQGKASLECHYTEFDGEKSDYTCTINNLDAK